MNDGNQVRKGPHTVDMHVGEAVRFHRKLRGLSQNDLAQAVGMTFQQIQKYERGANRISSSVLYQISRTLKMPIQAFFEGLEGEDATGDFVESRSEKLVHAFLRTVEGIEIAEAFPRIRKPAVKRKILDLVNNLAGEVEDDA